MATVFAAILIGGSILIYFLLVHTQLRRPFPVHADIVETYKALNAQYIAQLWRITAVAWAVTGLILLLSPTDFIFGSATAVFVALPLYNLFEIIRGRTKK